MRFVSWRDFHKYLTSTSRVSLLLKFEFVKKIIPLPQFVKTLFVFKNIANFIVFILKIKILLNYKKKMKYC